MKNVSEGDSRTTVSGTEPGRRLLPMWRSCYPAVITVTQKGKWRSGQQWGLSRRLLQERTLPPSGVQSPSGQSLDPNQVSSFTCPCPPTPTFPYHLMSAHINNRATQREHFTNYLVLHKGGSLPSPAAHMFPTFTTPSPPI